MIKVIIFKAILEEFAKKTGVSFVQLLEPKAAGRYAGEEVELNLDEIKTLENWYQKYNDSKKYPDYQSSITWGITNERLAVFGQEIVFYTLTQMVTLTLAHFAGLRWLMC